MTAPIPDPDLLPDSATDPATDPVTDPATDPAIDHPSESPADGGRPPRRRRVDKTLLVVSFFVGLGLMLVIRGVLIGVTGDDRAPLPAAIEQLDPVPEAVRVLSQTRVFVDLAPGYTGRLIIDDEEIETVSIDRIGQTTPEPGQQISLPPATIYEPGNATLTFTPTEGAPIEQFDEGLHRATVVYWLIEDGPGRSRTYSWTFNTV